MSEASNPSSESVSDSKLPGRYKPLRVWPAVLLVVTAIVSRLVAPLFMEDGPMFLAFLTMMAPLFACGLILLWWLAISRATILERVVGLVGTLVVAGIAIAISHSTMLGPGTMFVTLPLGTGAFALGAILCCRYLSFNRTVIAILLASCGFGFGALLRSNGMWGSFAMALDWRWVPSAEEAMLAERDSSPEATAELVTQAEFDTWLADPQWPGFRGPGSVSQQHGPPIESDWTAHEPELLWKIPVGPAWSSFAVAGNLLYTQEQHGDQELVVCYLADSGKEVWRQSIDSRFFDSLGGPGPRATPTLANGGLFVQGASGHLQRLDPRNGSVIWKQDLRKVAKREPPVWGFSSSPLVVGQNVVVHAGGNDDKGLLAFDTETGDLAWSAAAGDHSYCSAHRAELGDQEVVLMLTNAGLNVVDPATGEQRLNYKWKHDGYRVLQPQLVDGDSVLLPTGMGVGTRKLRIIDTDGTLSAEETWTSLDLKPDFNDFVVYDGHMYGFDGSLFTCVDLETGDRVWKKGRYGKGQVLLLADSQLLLVATEFGEVVLLSASPTGHEELAKLAAIEGKTWNHPVVVGDRLYVRNAQEAACFRLPLKAGNETEAE